MQLQLLTSCHLLPAELEALELKEEFARRLGEQQRTIDILKAGPCCRVSSVPRLAPPQQAQQLLSVGSQMGWVLVRPTTTCCLQGIDGNCDGGTSRSVLHYCMCVQDTNQKLQAKVRDAAADSSSAEGQVSSLQAKVAKQQ